MDARLQMSVALVLLTTLSGCDTLATAPAGTSPDALYAVEDAPPPVSGNPNGAVVMRFQNVEFMLVFDAERELMAAHMPTTICRQPGLTVVDVQRVDKPSQVGPLVSRVSADEAAVAIYRTSSPSDAGVASTVNSFFFSNVVDATQLCAFLEGPQRIAQGTVRRFTTFSAASFHGQWTGTIQGVDGQDYHLTEVYQLNADAHDPFNPDTFYEPVVAIHLRPIG